MKPVAIFRFSAQEGPGYFTEFLDAKVIPWVLIKIDQGEEVPSDPGKYSGICLMGGPMSVNDPLPWVKHLCGLIRQAFVKDIPMIGHCLGGQLISRALGGKVEPNKVKEIGWSQLFPARSSVAKKWFGELANEPFTVFQWHGETFSIPMQAELIAINNYCRNQIVAFGSLLAMQCHVEMTPQMISDWCEHWDTDAGHLPVRSNIQTPKTIQLNLDDALPKLHLLADHIYTEWLLNLKY